jgi:hypothetical protein
MMTHQDVRGCTFLPVGAVAATATGYPAQAATGSPRRGWSCGQQQNLPRASFILSTRGWAAPTTRCRDTSEALARWSRAERTCPWELLLIPPTDQAGTAALLHGTAIF